MDLLAQLAASQQDAMAFDAELADLHVAHTRLQFLHQVVSRHLQLCTFEKELVDRQLCREQARALVLVGGLVLKPPISLPPRLPTIGAL